MKGVLSARPPLSLQGSPVQKVGWSYDVPRELPKQSHQNLGGGASEAPQKVPMHSLSFSMIPSRVPMAKPYLEVCPWDPPSVYHLVSEPSCRNRAQM